MTAVALQPDISPNMLLAAAGHDELPGERLVLNAGDILPVLGHRVWFPLTSVVRIEVGHHGVLGGWVDHQGAIGLAGETRASTGLDWIVSSPGSALLVEAAFVHALMDRAHRFSRAVISWLHDQACAARHLAASNARDKAAQRIVSFLLAMDSHGVPGVHFTMSQEQIAKLTAVQRTTACGVLLSLKKASIIAYSRTKIRVIDRDRLAALDIS